MLAAASLFTVSCTQKKAEKTTDYPMFWTWLDYHPGMNFDSICTVMNEVAIPIAHKHGIEVYAWLWTMNTEHDRDKLLKAEGIAIFTVSGLRSPEIRAQFKAYTDSVKALHSQSKVNPGATGRTTININPFENSAKQLSRQ